jgi:hypothetical protein
MKEIEKVWTQGPTHKLLDASRFEIVYRYRENEWDEWRIKTIGSTARTAEDACKRTVGFLSKRHPNWTVQLVDCIDRGDEVDIQTGQKVEVVSDQDYAAIKQRAEEAIAEYERKEEEERLKDRKSMS